MPDLVRSVQAAASGTATVTISGESIPTGMVWVVSQISIETLPTRVTASATIRKNGRYLTSSAQGSASSAQGPPYISLTSHDILTIAWTGMTLNDSCIATLLYNEHIWGDPLGDVAVV